MISYVVLCAMVLTVTAEEPQCSKYDFLEKILEKLVRMEYQMERMITEDLERAENMAKTKADVTSALESQDQRVAEFRSKLQERSVVFEQSMTDTVDRMLKRVESIAEASAIPTIVFKARLQSHMSDLTEGDHIVFPIVMLNEGDAYDSKIGVFVAPVNGTYMFNVIFCVASKKALYIGIMVDGTSTTRVVFRGESHSPCHTVATVEVLNVGQRVWVQVLNSMSGHIIYQESTYRWNIFSGTLLHK